MVRPLSPPEMALLQAETDYLNAGIPVWGSRVLDWNGMTVLIYHSETQGYFTTNITDLGPARIAEIARQSEVHGIWYYLPQSISEVIAEDAETAIDAVKAIGGATTDLAKATADAVGQTLANLLNPVVESLLVPLVIVGVILGIYLIKKG